MRVSPATKARTRQALLDAARRLFARDGFTPSSTRALAREAGVAAGTLFNYFPTKEDLATALVLEALTLARARCEQRRTGRETLEEDLFACVAFGLRELEDLRPCLGPVLESSLAPLRAPGSVPAAEALRAGHLDDVAAILARHGRAEDLGDPVAVHLWWTLFLGVLAFFAADASPEQEDTLVVLDRTVQLFCKSNETPGGTP